MRIAVEAATATRLTAARIRIRVAFMPSVLLPNAQMSHDGSGRGPCSAWDVPAPVVGSGALLGFFIEQIFRESGQIPRVRTCGEQGWKIAKRLFLVGEP